MVVLHDYKYSILEHLYALSFLKTGESQSALATHLQRTLCDKLY
jgi:hypothetical protein